MSVVVCDKENFPGFTLPVEFGLLIQTEDCFRWVDEKFQILGCFFVWLEYLPVHNLKSVNKFSHGLCQSIIDLEYE